MGQCHCLEETLSSKDVEKLYEEEPPLTVTILRGRGMRGPEWFPGGATEKLMFCTVGLPGEKPVITTGKVKETLEPFWGEEVGFLEYLPGTVLQFCVWDTIAGGEPEILGKANLKPEVFASGFVGELPLKQDRNLREAHLAVKIRHQNSDYPEVHEEFSLMIDNSAKKVLGIEFDCQDGATMCVTSIKAGPIQSHNNRAKTAHRVELGDFIMQVNGIKGDAAGLRERLQKDSRLELVIRRPVLLEVALGLPKGLADAATSRPGLFGMELKEATGNALLLLRVVEGGLLEEWNASYPNQALRIGDRIVGVDGSGGKADDLLKRIQASERIHMTVIRPCGLEAKPVRSKPVRGSRNSPRVPPLPLHRLDSMK